MRRATVKNSNLPDDLPTLSFADSAAFEAWLSAAPTPKGVWMKIAKKDNRVVTVTYAEALDVALCHGWIDGQRRSLDARFFLQRFTPRRAKSLWSQINVGHVARLVEAGRMREGGLREIEKAKADGRWDAAYGGGRTMEVPPELAEALAKNRKASDFFATLNAANRYAVCWRVYTARKPETKTKRVEQFVAMLARGEKLH
jgi:uncharacterized protein YdeI (YjbR/CyaY-like superfamily)